MNRGFLSKCVFIAALSAAPVLAADVIATGLNNPRGIAISPNGDLFVAEAGTGGTGPCIHTSDGTVPCFGTTGSITRIDLRKGTQERVATGFPSLAGPTGGGALGPAGISFQGQGNGYIAVGLGSNPANRSALGKVGADMAHEARMQPNGKWSVEADLGTFEMTNNPAGGPIDTDPFGILALPGKQIVADAGGNDLLEISANGKIQTLAVFPDQSGAEPVPTTVVVGPDGAYYVGQLTGFPFQPGSANVYRVAVDGGTPTVAYSGFTNIISIAFGPDGSLYVLEISKNGLLSGNPAGALIKVLPDGTRTELAAGALSMPGGLALDSDGTIYVTNWSVLPGGGQVLRIQQ